MIDNLMTKFWAVLKQEFGINLIHYQLYWNDNYALNFEEVRKEKIIITLKFVSLQ
jgi:uncharacterized protein YcfL